MNNLHDSRGGCGFIDDSLFDLTPIKMSHNIDQDYQSGELSLYGGADEGTGATTAPAEVIGYHGCSRSVAEAILAGASWLPSMNAYDWLGQGIYFWEYGLSRASEWAIQNHGNEGVVVRANVRLGNCLNLLDVTHFENLTSIYNATLARAHELGIDLLKNRGKLHFLDRQIVEFYCQDKEELEDSRFQTVRGCFPEGTPLFPGSKILRETHIQVAVRDDSCISNVGW